MMNLVRSLAVGEPQVFKEKFKALLHQMIHPMVREIEYLRQEGRVRQEIDPRLAGYYLMGVGEYGAYLANQGIYPPDEVRELVTDFILNGLFVITTRIFSPTWRKLSKRSSWLSFSGKFSLFH